MLRQKPTPHRPGIALCQPRGPAGQGTPKKKYTKNENTTTNTSCVMCDVMEEWWVDTPKRISPPLPKIMLCAAPTGGTALPSQPLKCKKGQPDSGTACLVTVTTQPGMLTPQQHSAAPLGGWPQGRRGLAGQEGSPPPPAFRYWDKGGGSLAVWAASVGVQAATCGTTVVAHKRATPPTTLSVRCVGGVISRPGCRQWCASFLFFFFWASGRKVPLGWVGPHLPVVQ